MRNINIEIPDDIHFKARELSMKKHITFKKFVTQAIEEKIKSDEIQMQSIPIKSDDVQKQPIMQNTEPSS